MFYDGTLGDPRVDPDEPSGVIVAAVNLAKSTGKHKRQDTEGISDNHKNTLKCGSEHERLLLSDTQVKGTSEPTSGKPITYRGCNRTGLTVYEYTDGEFEPSDVSACSSKSKFLGITDAPATLSGEVINFSDPVPSYMFGPNLQSGKVRQRHTVANQN